MPIQFACKSCGKQFAVKDELAGKKGKCNQCGAETRVPTPSPSPEMRPSPPSAPAPSPLPVTPARIETVSFAPVPATANVQVVMNNPPQSKGVNGLGVAGVIFGILAALICWIPLVNLLALPLIFVGGLLAIVGVLVALTGKKSGVGWPIAGVSLNAFAFAVLLFMNLVVGGVAVDAARKAAKEAQVKARQAEAQAKAKIEAPQIDTSSDAVLDASIKAINDSLDEEGKKQFQADCITVTMLKAMPEMMKSAFSGKKAESPKKTVLFEPLEGLNAEQVHEKAEEIRRDLDRKKAANP